jgi:hypothetical protein
LNHFLDIGRIFTLLKRKEKSEQIHTKMASGTASRLGIQQDVIKTETQEIVGPMKGVRCSASGT